MTQTDPLPIDMQIACVEREIKYRTRAYPRWIKAGKMSAAEAEYQLMAMRAVRDTLRRVQEQEPL